MKSLVSESFNDPRYFHIQTLRRAVRTLILRGQIAPMRANAPTTTDHLNMTRLINEALAERGYDTLTPVQEAVSDPDLAGRDLLV